MPAYIKPYKGKYLIAIYETGGEERCLASCLNPHELAASLYGKDDRTGFTNVCSLLKHAQKRDADVIVFGGQRCEIHYIPVKPKEVAQMVAARPSALTYWNVYGN